MDFEVELRGFDEQMMKLEKFDEIFNKRALRAMTDSTKAIARVTRSNSRGSIGGAVQHIAQISLNEGVIGKVENPAAGALWYEFGTAPHGVSSEAIMANISVDRSTAFLIARSIKMRGTKGKFPMYRAFRASAKLIKTYFSHAKQKMIDDLKVK